MYFPEIPFEINSTVLEYTTKLQLRNIMLRMWDLFLLQALSLVAAAAQYVNGVSLFPFPQLNQTQYLIWLDLESSLNGMQVYNIRSPRLECRLNYAM